MKLTLLFKNEVIFKSSLSSLCQQVVSVGLFPQIFLGKSQMRLCPLKFQENVYQILPGNLLCSLLLAGQDRPLLQSFCIAASIQLKRNMSQSHFLALISQLSEGFWCYPHLAWRRGQCSLSQEEDRGNPTETCLWKVFKQFSLPFCIS